MNRHEEIQKEIISKVKLNRGTIRRNLLIGVLSRSYTNQEIAEAFWVLQGEGIIREDALDIRLLPTHV